MQGKGLIKVLFVLLLGVTILQCAYILPTRRVEADAAKMAEQLYGHIANEEEAIALKRQAKSNYLDSMSSEKIFSIPLLKSFTYDELKKQQLHLGLDLRGGQSVVLQVNMRDLMLELSNRSKDNTFLEALDKAQEALRNSQLDFVSLFADEFEKIAGGKKLAKIFLRNPSLREDINAQSSNGEVIRVLREKANDVVSLTFNRLKQRIDKLGVTQPNIQLDANRDLIIVELPGIDNPERARNFLQASAQLEFWNVYRITDPGIETTFRNADQILKAEFDGAEVINTPLFDTIYIPQFDSIGNITDSVQQINERPFDPLINQGPLLRSLKVNTTGSGGLAVMGTADRNQRDAVMNYLNHEKVRSLFPRDAKFLWSQKPIQDYQTRRETNEYELYMIRKEPGSDAAPLEGDVVINASQSPDPMSGEITVSLLMNPQGAREWAEMTTVAANDNNREIAIALDNEVVSAPRVNDAITGGNSSITGNFTVEEASDLANILEVGKLPAKVQIIQESTVGPSLGQQNIQRSLASYMAGLVLILIFMLIYYGGGGVVSVIALFANMFFIFGALASFGTVLTLPGIAGVLLTIGMAVDANVIIFERIREELRAGKSLLASIEDGFKNSYSAIIDANVSTIVVAFILAYFGMGPIKGFAVVLIIGVLSSLFTAVLVGKLMIDWWTQSKGRNLSFWTPPFRNSLANIKVDWLGKRKITYMFSAAIIILGLVSISTKGFDLGVDFTGGYSYVVKFTDDVQTNAEDLRNTLETTFEGASTVVKSVDVENTFNIVTSYLIDDTSEGVAEKVVAKLHEGVNGLVGGDLELGRFSSSNTIGATHIISSSKVGPTIADDIKKSSFKAGFFALLAIFLYIFLRFNKWQYSLGAVAALFHDSLIVLGLFSILWGVVPFSLEMDQAFIAALLTVIAYSINDTVVVFDRIREYLRIYNDKSSDEVLNLAISSTFSRTVVTSLTTLIVVVMLLIFSGGSIKGFAFALMIGILVGTYSSIFIATPIVRDLSKDLKPSRAKAKKHFSRAVK